jgi:hypothetical protein
MSTRNLTRRLERLEAEVALPEEEVYPFMVTWIGDDGKMHWRLSEMRTPKVNGRLRPSEGRWVALGSGRGTGEEEYTAALKRSTPLGAGTGHGYGGR